MCSLESRPTAVPVAHGGDDVALTEYTPSALSMYTQVYVYKTHSSIFPQAKQPCPSSAH